MTATTTRDQELDALFATEGPMATLYVGRSDQLTDLVPRRALRWRQLREDLAASGADEPTLRALDDAVDRLGPANDSLVAVATGGQVVWSRQLDAPFADRAVWEPVPSLLPLLAHEQSRLTHLVVLTDRTGADLRLDLDGSRMFAQVEGGDDEIERNAPGGWSQRRYQDRAEDSWAHNAARVADTTARLADQTDPALVLVGGDVRAVQLLREHLPARVSPRVRELRHGGGRQPGEDDRPREEEIRVLVDAEARRQATGLLERFAEDRAHGLAADGVAATVVALARSQAGALLVVDDPADDRIAWFGPDPRELATSPDGEALSGRFEAPRAGRLVDVAVRAALGTGAAVRVVPADQAESPAEGLGALLRYPDYVG
jgi:hypothetical protein